MPIPMPIMTGTVKTRVAIAAMKKPVRFGPVGLLNMLHFLSDIARVSAVSHVLDCALRISRSQSSLLALDLLDRGSGLFLVLLPLVVFYRLLEATTTGMESEVTRRYSYFGNSAVLSIFIPGVYPIDARYFMCSSRERSCLIEGLRF